MITLQHLWARKTASVRDLHTDISKSRKIGYTTILKQIQRMEEKGFVKRVSSSGRSHTFAAVYQPKRTQKSLVKRLIETAFNDSPNALIQHAIGAHTLSPQDIKEIRALLSSLEKEA